MLKELKRDHHIVYLTLDDGTASADARERATEYCDELICIPHHTRPKFSPGFYLELLTNLTSSYPYFMKKYRSRGMEEEIERLNDANRFDVLVCDFLQPSVNVSQGLSAPSVLFQHNVEAMIWKRHYEVQQNPLKKLYLHNQWTKSVRCEREACRRFGGVVAVSAEDRRLMREQYGVDRVVDVPTGVDVQYFTPSGNVQPQPHNLVFTGSMDWLPNEDGIQYFLKDILPLIRKEIPDVSLTVVGRNPYSSLLEAAQHDPAIIVTGRVDDVRPYMERAAAYVVPLRIGGGTRLKIFEALAMEKPVISTTIGAEGLPVQDERDLLLADEPPRFAQQVVRVLRDTTLANQLGSRAASLVREQFSWKRAAESFAGFCMQVLENESPGPEVLLRPDLQNAG
jgi:polysaccharide biosynthesis protein PslH